MTLAGSASEQTGTTPAAGLTEAEALARLEQRGPLHEPASSRSLASIVRANTLTPFNAILVSLGVLTLVFGDWRDALFLGIVVVNSGIGIWQELRAKRKLDELAALVAPVATVVRSGTERELAVSEVVDGDLIRVAAGDQVVADGELLEANGLLLDEANLTGESAPVSRGAGSSVRSGSFAVAGIGAYQVHAVGPESYAERIAGEARTFRHPRSPLERTINKLLYVLAGAMVPLGAMLIVALSRQDVDTRQAVETAVAGMVTLIPEGLVLLLSITYAAAAITFARRGALVQQLNAIESLASVDTLCIDKTGTLTEPSLRVVRLVPASGVDPEGLGAALGRLAASATARNATLDAIAERYPGEPWQVEEAVPFSSTARWSGLRTAERGYVLGAPELFALGGLEQAAGVEQRSGRRVLAFGATTGRFPEEPDAPPPPAAVQGLVVLSEELRPSTRETIAFLQEEGVDVKVLSGDDPATVGAIARDAGLAVELPPVDARDLGEDERALREGALGLEVVGRITPDGKRRVVEALAARGRYVAMLGDGVNDVPALKASRLAIAQGTGSQMTKAVSDVVLVFGDFASVPRMVAEGRKILRNIQRVSKLFVAKAVFAAFMIVAIGLTPTQYPLLPRHLTVVAALTVGIPSFFLALAPSSGPWRTDGFLRDVARFAVPAGIAAGLGVLYSYLVTLNVLDAGLVEARTAATTTLVMVGLYLVLALESTSSGRSAWVGVLCGALLATYIALLAADWPRTFFELEVPGPATIAVVLVGVALAVGFLRLNDDQFAVGRRRSRPEAAE